LVVVERVAVLEAAARPGAVCHPARVGVVFGLQEQADRQRERRGECELAQHVHLMAGTTAFDPHLVVTVAYQFSRILFYRDKEFVCGAV